MKESGLQHRPGAVAEGVRVLGMDDTSAVPAIGGMQELFARQRAAHAAVQDVGKKQRIDRLNRLLALVDENEQDIARAISTDFGHRSLHETYLTESFVVRTGIRHAKKHLGRWMRPRRVPTGLQYWPAHNTRMTQPLGIVGVVVPWNYPLQLSMGPVLAALAAGNRVLIKPSELTPTFSALLGRLVARYFAPEEMSVVNGGAEVGRAFVGLPFDHLFFTGSGRVGRLVAQAAAENLTPVTLELGGKSPAILDPSCDRAAAAQRIAFGKCLNAGQTCVAPDYLLVPAGQAAAVAMDIKAAIIRLYPSLAGNPDYTAIINAQHRERLAAMVEEVATQGTEVIEVNPAGETFGSGSKFPPTLVINPAPDSRLMSEEIFGPILPIIEYADLDDAIRFVNRRDRPLALYWFGRNGVARERVLRETVAGGVTVNDCLWHLAQEDQPFGGVGPSGSGAYHGEWGFRTFSKEKPVFHQARWPGTLLLYPPYGATFRRLLGVLKKIA